jgi:hypothetical protein
LAVRRSRRAQDDAQWRVFGRRRMTINFMLIDGRRALGQIHTLAIIAGDWLMWNQRWRRLSQAPINGLNRVLRWLV